VYDDVVTRGVKLLDERTSFGVSWPFHVDINRLNLVEWNCCVLGQLFGNYFDGVTELMLLHPAQYGFDLDNAVGPVSLEHYARLTDAWRTRIELLRAERAMPPTSA
jgi:hypothetical protein